MKELLVHVLSPATAQLFITYAAYLARDLNLTVKYIHVQAPANFPLAMPGSLSATGKVTQIDIDRETEKARHHFKNQIEKLYASEPDLPLLEYHIEVGHPPEIIYEYCKSKSVDSIMLSSSKGGSLFSDDTSNIDIIRKVRCPVWIIPEGIIYKPFSEILYATDYHEEDLPNLKLLARFASRFPASITAVHITRDAGFQDRVKGEGFASMIKKETGYEMISIKILNEKKGEPLVEELHNFALMMDADLIVLLRENRGFTDRLFHGSRSEKIARETQLPVLIFNEERKQ
jgi:nucleotide-binding universal stress UspA family protein